MVLEELYSVDFIKKKPYFAFLLGISYSIIGMGGAIFLFPDDPALVAVALTSMLMLPLVRKLVSNETSALFKKTKEIFKIYILLFLGSFLTFALFAMMLPKMAANFLFQNQLHIYFGSITGKAFSLGLFQDLFNNNLKVLMFCFILSLVLAGGSIFIIIWNASLWGTIFGTLAKYAAATTGQNQWMLFGLIFAIVFPHMILEVSSYIISSISGNLFSFIIVSKETLMDVFKTKLNPVVYVLLTAVAVLVVAMLIETYVLQTATIYRTIIQSAFANVF